MDKITTENFSRSATVENYNQLSKIPDKGQRDFLKNTFKQAVELFQNSRSYYQTYDQETAKRFNEADVAKAVEKINMVFERAEKHGVTLEVGKPLKQAFSETLTQVKAETAEKTQSISRSQSLKI